MKQLFVFLTVVLIAAYIETEAGDSADPIHGYIITLNGDSIHGELLTKSEKKAYLSLEFKADNESSGIKYNPGDIISFSSQAQYYRSFKFFKEGDSVDVFIKRIIQGEIDLYYSRLETGQDNRQFTTHDYYFIGLQKGEIRQIPAKNLKNILLYILSDCDGLFEKHINNARPDFYYYDFNKLYEIIYEYNQCRGRLEWTASSIAETRKVILSSGLIIGLNHDKIKENNPDALIYGYPSESNPKISFGMYGQLDFNVRLSARFEALYETKKICITPESFKTPINYEYNYTLLSFPILINYRFSSEATRPYAGGGTSIDILLKDACNNVNNPLQFRPAIIGFAGVEQWISSRRCFFEFRYLQNELHAGTGFRKTHIHTFSLYAGIDLINSNRKKIIEK